MKNTFETIANTNSWAFDYGRTDYINLNQGSMVANTIYLFLDPIKTTKNFDDYNEVNSIVYEGRFMLLYSSDFDGDYNDHYTNHIQPLQANSIDLVRQYLAGCNNDYTINIWQETEIINVFDFNASGIICQFQITTDNV